MPWVTIHWDVPGNLRPVSESLRRSDRRLEEQLEVLTANSGWLPLGSLVASRKLQDARSTQEEGETLTRFDRAVQEAQRSHNPFRNQRSIGPGPRGGSNSETQTWRCRRRGRYAQVCDDGQRQKEIPVDIVYKRRYNREYRKWQQKNKGSDEK